jgi:hypothetical protein
MTQLTEGSSNIPGSCVLTDVIVDQTHLTSLIKGNQKEIDVPVEWPLMSEYSDWLF